MDKTLDHVTYFWQVLESMNQSELSQFLRFACNQDTLNQTSLGGQPNPPLPMKLAPCNINEDNEDDYEDEEEDEYEELSGENDDEEQDEEDNEESDPNEDDGENYFSADGGAVSRTSNSASNSNNSNQRSRNQLKIDQCMIRAETCMFMIKLPAYSSFEIMKTRLKQAISTRYDPLIG